MQILDSRMQLQLYIVNLVTGEAADGRTRRNFHGEVAVIFVVNLQLVRSANIGVDFSIKMDLTNKFSVLSSPFHPKFPKFDATV